MTQETNERDECRPWLPRLLKDIFEAFGGGVSVPAPGTRAVFFSVQRNAIRTLLPWPPPTLRERPCRYLRPLCGGSRCRLSGKNCRAARRSIDKLVLARQFSSAGLR